MFVHDIPNVQNHAVLKNKITSIGYDRTTYKVTL